MNHRQQDKSWMLNAKAIKAAKACIHEVEKELDIKLRLSHPDFIELLVEYAALTDSPALQQSLAELSRFSPVTIGDDTTRHPTPTIARITPLHPKNSLAPSSGESDENTVNYRGKSYPRYREGKEFKGLYRGQPRYI